LALSSFTSEHRAAAQQAQGFAVNRYEPSERGSEWFSAESLDYRGESRLALGLVGDYSRHALVIYNPDGTVRTPVIDHNLFAHLGVAIVLVERLRLGANLPVQLYTTGDDGSLNGVTYRAPPNAQGIGDLRLDADVRVYGTFEGPFRAAIGLGFWAPTGEKDQYTSDGKVRLMPRAQIAGDVGLFAYALKTGVVFHGRSESFAGSAIGNEFQVSAAGGYRTAGGKIVVGPEVFGTTYFEDGFKTRATPLEALLGVHLLVAPEVRVGAGIGTGLTRGYGSPTIRALLGVEWVPLVVADRDGDGVNDREDACPGVPGVADPDPAKNGCPARPTDRDHDGILDREDACVDVPGIRTSDPKTNGCPPSDRDHDGIVDAQDACPDLKGPPNSTPALNGCPDSDGDGVFDPVDACVHVPGMKTGDPKTNGCPDPDRDKDGIENAKDACPDEPGKPDPDPKRNGCPKAFVQEGQIKILDQVKFKTNSAEIVGKDSEDVLQAVQSVLAAHPQIKKVRVEGHTDSTGSAPLNRKLSAARAASVVKWLTSHGVDASRLTSAGFGPDKPIDDNKTEEGRRNNRRVEFHIEESQ
jgi:outer membrane protein OmpA-like peptidoglycan-associated protein